MLAKSFHYHEPPVTRITLAREMPKSRDDELIDAPPCLFATISARWVSVALNERSNLRGRFG